MSGRTYDISRGLVLLVAFSVYCLVRICIDLIVASKLYTLNEIFIQIFKSIPSTCNTDQYRYVKAKRGNIIRDLSYIIKSR